MEYLLELRTRLLYCVGFTAIVFIFLCLFSNPLYSLLTKPLLLYLPAKNLIATKITSTFLVPMKFTLVVTLFLLMPFFFYQLWSFISPALYKNEKNTVWVLLFPTVILFYLGIAFAYFLVLPIIFHFFIQTTPAQVSLLPDIGQYLDLALQLLFAFGLTFEVPVIVFVLISFNICTLETLRSYRRYIIVLAFVIAMLISPPDVFSQTLLAIPLWLLYELGLVCTALYLKNKSQIQPNK